jgi:protein O-mannosyl-transferase
MMSPTRKYPGSLLSGLLPLLWLFLLGMILYGQTITYNYTYLDDHEIVLGQLDRINTLSYIPKAFTEDAFHTPAGKGFYYRPILTVSFVIDAVLGGGKLYWFHITNILLHIITTWLLFLLLIEMGYERAKSFFFTLLFMAHPILTHAVAWIPGRNDVLLALFVFPSFLFLLRYMRTNNSVFCLLHYAFYILALFSKESAIALPLAAILWFLLIAKRPWRSILLPASGWIIITPLWIWIRYHALGGSNGYPISESFLSIIHNLPALVPFIGKSLVPAGLSVFPILKDMTLPIIAGVLGIIGLAILLFTTKEKRWAYFIFAISWFLLFLLPSFIKTKSQDADFTEHRIYVSLAGLVIFLLETGAVRRCRMQDAGCRIVFTGVFLVFCILTVYHSMDYRNRITFWNNAVKTSPSHAFNYNNLGAMYFLDNNLTEAEKYFRKAVEINPVEPLANGNIGLVCMNTNRSAEAEKYYLREIEINPTYDNAYFNLGLLYYKNGFVEPALKMWEKTLKVNPRYTDAYRSLFGVYSSLNRIDDAERIRKMAAKNGMEMR